MNRKNGKTCVVNCLKDIMYNPPSKGSVIAVKHTGYDSIDRLKYPYFWQERRDLSWEDVVKPTLESHKYFFNELAKQLGMTSNRGILMLRTTKAAAVLIAALTTKPPKVA